MIKKSIFKNSGSWCYQKITGIWQKAHKFIFWMKVFARNFSLPRPFFNTPWSVLQGITKYHNKRETFFLLSRDYGEKKFLWKFHQFKPYNRIIRNSVQSFQIAPCLFLPISCKWRGIPDFGIILQRSKIMKISYDHNKLWENSENL